MGDNFPTKKSMIEIGYKPNQILGTKTKEDTIQPNSRDQICEHLMKRWKPKHMMVSVLQSTKVY